MRIASPSEYIHLPRNSTECTASNCHKCPSSRIWSLHGHSIYYSTASHSPTDPLYDQSVSTHINCHDCCRRTMSDCRGYKQCTWTLPSVASSPSPVSHRRHAAIVDALFLVLVSIGRSISFPLVTENYHSCRCPRCEQWSHLEAIPFAMSRFFHIRISQSECRLSYLWGWPMNCQPMQWCHCVPALDHSISHDPTRTAFPLTQPWNDQPTCHPSKWQSPPCAKSNSNAMNKNVQSRYIPVQHIPLWMPQHLYESCILRAQHFRAGTRLIQIVDQTALCANIEAVIVLDASMR